MTNTAQNPISADYTSIQNQVDLANGIAAEKTGQPYKVYRLNAMSAGNFIDPSNLIYTNYPGVIQVYKPDTKNGAQNRLITDKAFASLWLNIYADLRGFKTGDVWVLNDPVYGQGSTAVNYATDQFNGFAIGEHAPGGPAAAGRVDRLVQIYRISSTPNAKGYLNQTLDGSYPIVLSGGTFAQGTAGNIASAAQVPMGFLPEKRSRGNLYPQLGDVPGRTTAKIYVPPLPGFSFMENDILVSIEGDRYRVVNPYFQDTGVVGSQLIVDRVVAGLGV